MMKLMSLKQYMKMSKPALIRKITKALRAMPKAKLARLCYNITKSKLPRLRTVTRKRLSANYRRKGSKAQYAKGAKDMYQTLSWLPTKMTEPKRKTKRKFSRKQLAAQRLFAKRARAGTLRSSKGGFIFKGKRYSGTRMSYSNVNGRLVRR